MNLSEEFLTKGIVKIAVEDKSALENIKALFSLQCGYSLFKQGLMGHPDLDNFNLAHEYLKPEKLNEFRLAAITALNEQCWSKSAYLSLARNALHELVGNELVMQRNINLSIQLPEDYSSLLPIHADVLQGDSPYEVVLWVPLVNCYDTKSMFFARNWPDSLVGKTLEQLYEECNPYFVECKFGECLLFSQNWFHGNVVNKTNETRWSLNCRFKSLFSPYADKKLGEFFEPIDIKPATKLGMNYKYPKMEI